MKPYRVLVTGSRTWTDVAAVDREFAALARRIAQDGCDIVLVHGAAKGLDTIAAAEALHRHWTIGPAAGPIRNQAMVDLGADICLAFPTAKSGGTWDCVRRANAAGIRVIVVPERKS